MATELFHVKVLGKEETTVLFRLRIITGEQPGFYEGEAFALMLLYDPINKGGAAKDAPLAREFTFADLTDLDWMADHVENYIADVNLSDVKNHPPTADLAQMSGEERNEFFDSDAAPAANFEVTVTSPEWVEHITPGMEWETAAFDILS